MSKYSTDELVNMLASFLGASTAPSSVQYFEGDAMREAMRRLRAADKLCEDVKTCRIFLVRDTDTRDFLDKIITGYEEE